MKRTISEKRYNESLFEILREEKENAFKARRQKNDRRQLCLYLFLSYDLREGKF